jgi:hypothetical protein
MVRPCPPCQGLVESVALWDQLFQYSWKVVFENRVILSFSTLEICAKHMKECPKVFARLLFVDLAYYQGKKDIVFRFIIEYSSLKDFGPG